MTQQHLHDWQPAGVVRNDLGTLVFCSHVPGGCEAIRWIKQKDLDKAREDYRQAKNRYP